MSIGVLGLAFAAGVLSVLSPCVIPLLPIVLGTAASNHRLGAFALASGVTVSFVVIGLFLATIGFGIGLDSDLFRLGAAVLMIALGLVLAIPPLQSRLVAAGGPVSGWVDGNFGGFLRSGASGQFGVGLLLGAVWSPCVGPTLGAASVLAAQGKQLATVASTMISFGLGAGLTLVLLGSISRELLLRWRGGLSTTSSALKQALGIFLVAIGAMILTGADRTLETTLVDISPDWLTRLTTWF